jgi:hypothetical protein
MFVERMAKHKLDCINQLARQAENTAQTSAVRSKIQALHHRRGALETFATFNPQVSTMLKGVPRELLNPMFHFQSEVHKFVGIFQRAYERELRLAGLQLWALRCDA